MAHARFNAQKKRLVRFAPMEGKRKQIMADILKKIFTRAGRPKLVPAVLVPVSVALIEGIYDHGKKQHTINNTAAPMPT
jgi:hypothetical protein